MQHELVISGVGGQGILVASQLLGHSVVVEGKRAMYFSMFQGAQRGGVCECLVVIADGRVEASPVIMQPLVGSLAMHPNAFLRFEPLVRRGGLLVYNTSITMGTSDTKQSTGEGLALKADTTIELKPSRTDIALLGIPATDLAMNELGNQLQATLIALGAFIEISSIVSIESAKGSLAKTLPPHRQHFIPLNEQALDLGAKWAREKGELQNASALSLLGREAVHA
jgi:2-oxoglutarate ferredoxin oxidoreductase subunit gamma